MVQCDDSARPFSPPSPSPINPQSPSPSNPPSRPLSRTRSPASVRPQDRIEVILEIGRRRANSLYDTDTPRAPVVPMESLLHNDSAAGRPIDYQSTAVTSASSTPPRRRRAPPTATSEASHDRPDGAEQPLSWWASLLASVQTLELENKGSVARDHLALERTFLAWLRTSLAFSSIGIAVTQLFRLSTSSDSSSQLDALHRVGRPLGSTFLGISILILFLGYHRYYQSQQWILRGKFPASRGTVLLVSVVAFALMVASLVVVVVVQPHG
ncbi:pf02656 domain containing protein [Grosmannia clavigera kw1407]|uniref:Pf02656 domain containing protein n=1 Tax=Grosmannia clavigera (strain kw1407 / UAMH 11150) TaxID=655863 RepID=F0XD92_GROCL|nr:pf02656 domain containing protein [Grosmannia clavigera kw1407]EFX04129.1 pf02656 domain containing protein [Grosmannia clavigera kw1407]